MPKPAKAFEAIIEVRHRGLPSVADMNGSLCKESDSIIISIVSAVRLVMQAAFILLLDWMGADLHA
jgi:hypothetical protein